MCGPGFEVDLSHPGGIDTKYLRLQFQGATKGENKARKPICFLRTNAGINQAVKPEGFKGVSKIAVELLRTTTTPIARNLQNMPILTMGDQTDMASFRMITSNVEIKTA